MHIFYEPNIPSKIIALNELESKHCIKVLRLNIKDEILIIDGIGGLHTAKIIDNNPKKCIVEIIQTRDKYNKRDYYLHIAIAPTKSIDRFELFLEKSTEIGIDEITPIFCSRSERKILKPDRLNKVIQSAMKQATVTYFPILNDLTNIKKFVAETTNYDFKFIAHCEENKKLYLHDFEIKNKKCLIIIGPEGDFTGDEINLAKENDFIEISLSNNILRTETAGIVACNTISIINQ